MASEPELDALEGEGELWGEGPEELGELGEVFESGEGEGEGEDEGEGEGGGGGSEAMQVRRVFDEVEEMELAGAMLEVAEEDELDRFLGNLIRRAGRAVGSVVRSPVGQALGGILKNAARQALPAVGGAIGSAIDGQSGGALGGQLATKAGQIFGLELEGLSAEDREYEVARRFVRFASAAAANAAETPPTVPPPAAARNAAVTAARDHAPGLLGARPSRRFGAARGGQRARLGGWMRRGRSIVIVNCNTPGPSPSPTP